MTFRRRSLVCTVLLLSAAASLLAQVSCTKKSETPTSPAPAPVDLTLKVSAPFRFVVYGDTRFHDPTDTVAANPPVRQALVKAIAQANPAFICFTGDIVYDGYAY
jgi:hypothetical protein